MLQHLKAVWTFRYFWMSLVKMDLRSRYRRSFLGVGWSVLYPIAMSGVFCLIFSQIMKVSGDDYARYGYPAEWRAYAAYLLSGMMAWEFIKGSAVQGCQALVMNEAYIRQCPLPYGIYPLRTVMGTAIHFLISTGVTVVLVCLLKWSFEPVAALWMVLPVIVLMFAFCWALATIAAFVTVYFPDFSHLAEVGFQLLFFLSPIMYTADSLKPKGLGWMAEVNPFVPFLDLIRWPLVTGQPMDHHSYALAQAGAYTAVAVGLAFGVIAWLQKRVIFAL